MSTSGEIIDDHDPEPPPDTLHPPKRAGHRNRILAATVLVGENFCEGAADAARGFGDHR